MHLLLNMKSTDYHLFGTVDEYVDLKLHFLDANEVNITGVFQPKITRSATEKHTKYLILLRYVPK